MEEDSDISRMNILKSELQAIENKVKIKSLKHRGTEMYNCK